MTIWLTRLPPITLLAAIPLLVLGWTLPIMSVTSFWVITKNHSVLDGLKTFSADGEWLLLLAIGGFAVIFPALKIITGVWAWARPHQASGALKLAHSVSKWSMLDVFIIALVVMTAKSSVVADASVGIGAWCFTGAAIASTFALAGLAKRET